MKICMLADVSSIHVQRLGPALAERGHSVQIICHIPQDIPGVSVERFEVPSPGLTNPRRWQGRLTRYLRDLVRGFDVVSVQFLSDWGLTPQIMREGCVVASAYGSEIVHPPGEPQPSKELIETRVELVRHAAGVTAWGPTFAKMVADYAGIDVDRVDIAPLGVDLKLFSPNKHQAWSAPGSHRVGYFKGFREVYGAIDLISAMPTVLDNLPRTRFDLIGDGPQLSRCRELADKLKVNRVIKWVPRQPYRDVPGMLSDWDLTVMPSICESFGAAALESSAMRVPVVASTVGGIPDTVYDGETGLLVPPKSPEALAQAIVTLLADDATRIRMGEAGRQMVIREYEWSNVLRQWEEAFERALDRTRSVAA